LKDARKLVAEAVDDIGKLKNKKPAGLVKKALLLEQALVGAKLPECKEVD
jgi:hypothetical protein